MKANIKKYKVVVLDDHHLFTSLLVERIKKLDITDDVNSYTNPEEFLKQLPALHFDLLITDILMPKIRGEKIIQHCMKLPHLKSLKIIALSGIIDPTIIKKVIALGASAYVSKFTSLDELFIAIEYVTTHTNRDQPFLSVEVKNVLNNAAIKNNELRLTPRENNILLEICKGHTVKEVANNLQLSVNTIQGYMKVIFKKFNVTRTTDLVVATIKKGIYHPDQF